MPLYVGYGESGPGVSLTHECMARQPLRLQYRSPFYAMTNVWFRAVAADVRSITLEYAYVVQHRRLFYKRPVDFQPMRICASQGLVRNKPAVHLKYGAQPVVVSIIFVDYLLIFHLYYISILYFDLFFYFYNLAPAVLVGLCAILYATEFVVECCRLRTCLCHAILEFVAVVEIIDFAYG